MILIFFHSINVYLKASRLPGLEPGGDEENFVVSEKQRERKRETGEFDAESFSFSFFSMN